MKFAAEIPGDCFQIMFTDRKLKSKIMGQSFEWQPADGSLVTDTNRKFLWVSGSIARCQLPWKFLTVHEVQILTDSKWCHSFTTVLPKGYLGISYNLMSNLTHESTLLFFRCVNDFLFLISLSPPSPRQNPLHSAAHKVLWLLHFNFVFIFHKTTRVIEQSSKHSTINTFFKFILFTQLYIFF